MVRHGSVPFGLAYFFLLKFKFDEMLLGGGGGSGGSDGGDGGDSDAGIFLAREPLAAVAARDGRGGPGSPCGARRRACGGVAIPTAREAGADGREGVGGPPGARDTATLAWACACSCRCTDRYI